MLQLDEEVERTLTYEHMILRLRQAVPLRKQGMEQLHAALASHTGEINERQEQYRLAVGVSEGAQAALQQMQDMHIQNCRNHQRKLYFHNTHQG